MNVDAKSIDVGTVKLKPKQYRLMVEVRQKGLTFPGQGPTLVWRAVCEDVMPPPSDWHVGLGDIELF